MHLMKSITHLSNDVLMWLRGARLFGLDCYRFPAILNYTQAEGTTQNKADSGLYFFCFDPPHNALSPHPRAEGDALRPVDDGVSYLGWLQL